MSFLDFWQNLPSLVSPSFNLFGFSIQYYSLAYLFGFLAVYLLGLRSIAKFSLKIKRKDFENLCLNGFLMAILGGRVFYVLFYNLAYFLERPLEIIWPFNELGNFVGISGMSFHGGFIFTFLYLLFALKKYDISYKDFQIALVPQIPIAIFLGRLANFLNGELYGRVTESKIGMYFNDVLRHPSQLYEAFLEGILLFFILNYIKKTKQSKFLGAYLAGFYLLFRIFVEFFREPDVQLGLFWGFSMGQILSVLFLTLIFFLVKTIKSKES
ncbi:prolipoprotein diacylglyceryl transferase [bacterium]|nr:prolipoprotein diacylglyceryl transferase [bacterium]